MIPTAAARAALLLSLCCFLAPGSLARRQVRGSRPLEQIHSSYCQHCPSCSAAAVERGQRVQQRSSSLECPRLLLSCLETVLS